MVVFYVFVLFSVWFACGLAGVRMIDPAVDSPGDRGVWVSLAFVFGPMVFLVGVVARLPWGQVDGFLFPSSVDKWAHRNPAPMTPVEEEHTGEEKM